MTRRPRTTSKKPKTTQKKQQSMPKEAAVGSNNEQETKAPSYISDIPDLKAKIKECKEIRDSSPCPEPVNFKDDKWFSVKNRIVATAMDAAIDAVSDCVDCRLDRLEHVAFLLKTFEARLHGHFRWPDQVEGNPEDKTALETNQRAKEIVTDNIS